MKEYEELYKVFKESLPYLEKLYNTIEDSLLIIENEKAVNFLIILSNDVLRTKVRVKQFIDILEKKMKK